MKIISSLLASFVLIFALITGCSQSPNSKSNTDTNTDNSQSEITLEKETPKEVLKKAIEVSKNVKGYKYTSTKKDNSQQITETGEEQYNPEVAHFKATDGSTEIEYYYDKQNIYKSKDGKTWTKTANSSGNVLSTNGFMKLANQLITSMGEKDTIDGVTLKKESDSYIITVDKKVYQDPDLSAEEFEAIKKYASVAKSELTFDSKTFELKKYHFELTGEENGEKFNRLQDVELSNYSTPITIPDNVKNS